MIAALAVATAVAACDKGVEQQLAPAPMALSAGKTPKVVRSIGRPHPLAQDITKSVTVGTNGGTLEIKEAGLKLTIPSHALPLGTTSMTISVTAYAGSQFAYEFEPSGTVFMRPLEFEQDVAGVNITGSLVEQILGPKVQYFRSRADLDPIHGLATTLEDLLTITDVSTKKVKANVWHFSGYMVAW